VSYQAYLDAVEKKTGHTPQQLLDRAVAMGFTPTTAAAVVVEWLKDEYDLGRGHSMALYGVLKNGATVATEHVPFQGRLDSGGTHSDPSDELRLDGIANR
jgi:Domain of unknown function (DUF4287)